MGINNPVPRSLKSETKKAAKVLVSFIKPNQVLGTDQVIPPNVLKSARGLAIITVFKAGFLFSGRAGSGVIVARLPDGTWSAPSAIGLAGAGAGGLVGIELTDFVFILNSPDAVRSFSEFGTVTLGGNISVAAGPLGRNAEADAAASAGGFAAVFSYSKTKGLFAGVSVEGSVILERREANRKFYGGSATTKQILAGRVRPPPAADPLFRVLESRAFNFRSPDEFREDEFYDDIPESFDSFDTSSVTPATRTTRRRGRGGYYDEDAYDSDDEFNDSGSGRFGSRGGGFERRDRYGGGGDRYSGGGNDRYGSGGDRYSGGGGDRYGGGGDRYSGGGSDRYGGGGDRYSGGGGDRYGSGGGRRRGSSFGNSRDDPAGVNEYYRSQRKARAGASGSRLDDDPYERDRDENDRYDRDRYDQDRSDRDRYDRDVDELSNRFSKSRISSGQSAANGRVSRPLSEKPDFGTAELGSPRSSNTPKAVALYTFSGEEYGDLPFRKGDVITILKKSDSQDDWWTGRVNEREGIFPANYVELV